MLRRTTALGFVLVALCAACAGGAGDEPTPLPTLEVAEATPASGPIGVTLGEWSVLSDEEIASAGTIEFTVDNDGRVVHELLVIRSDAAAGELPTTSDGAVDASAVDVVAEAKNIAVEAQADLTAELTAGEYALVCNIVDTAENGMARSHYKLGMWTELVVQ